MSSDKPKLTISQLLNKNEKIRSINYPFNKLKIKQIEFFKNKNKDEEMNVREKNLKDLIKIFNEHNINYWLQGKTLLGMVRDNKLIKNDHDEDIGTMSENIEKVCLEIIPELKNIGFEVIRAASDNSMVSVMRNFRYIDICFFSKKGNNIGYQKKYFPQEYYKSFTEIVIDNFNYRIPIKNKEIIKYSYNIKL